MMNNTQQLKPFDIVTAYYVDLQGRIKTDLNGQLEPALFVVLFVNCDNTVTVCKITSNSYCGNNKNNYFLKMEEHPFLQCHSWVQTDKLMTLSAHVCRKVGGIATRNLCGLREKITRSIGAMRLQMEEYSPAYSSPNKKTLTPNKKYEIMKERKIYGNYKNKIYSPGKKNI